MPNTMRDAHVAGERSVVARAPARIDLAGGWTDVPPYSDEEGGCVCNIAITRHATVRLRSLGADDVHAFQAPGRRETSPTLAMASLARAELSRNVVAGVWSDFPVSAGLGGSSAAGVALAAAADAWRRDVRGEMSLDDDERDRLAEWSRVVEVEDAGIAGGRQDHYAAAYGGALRIAFGADADGAPARATRLALSSETIASLERRAIVVYTGESRISRDTIVAVLDAYRDREARVVHALARTKAIAREMGDALEAADVDAIGALLDEQWTHQRALHPSITTARIDALVARAAAAGSIGAKALGASGGGCVLLLAADGREDAVRAVGESLGTVVPFAVDTVGVKVSCE